MYMYMYVCTQTCTWYVQCAYTMYVYGICSIICMYTHVLIQLSHLSSQIHSHLREGSQVDMLELQLGDKGQTTLTPVLVVQVTQVPPGYLSAIILGQNTT